MRASPSPPPPIRAVHWPPAGSWWRRRGAGWPHMPHDHGGQSGEGSRRERERAVEAAGGDATATGAVLTRSRGRDGSSRGSPHAVHSCPPTPPWGNIPGGGGRGRRQWEDGRRGVREGAPYAPDARDRARRRPPPVPPPPPPAVTQKTTSCVWAARGARNRRHRPCRSPVASRRCAGAQIASTDAEPTVADESEGGWLAASEAGWEALPSSSGATV